MPVHRNKDGSYQYGKTGKKYYGENARHKAEKQGAAIRASQRAAGKPVK